MELIKKVGHIYVPIVVKLLTSINSEIDCRNNGNVLIARDLLDALQAKICWGILTP